MIEEFVAPSSLERIDQGAFCGCRNLRRVELNEGLRYLGSTWGCGVGVFENTALKEIKVPSTVTTLGRQTFEGCKSLTNVQLPAQLAFIGEYCFYGTGLTEVTIPG